MGRDFGNRRTGGRRIRGRWLPVAGAVMVPVLLSAVSPASASPAARSDAPYHIFLHGFLSDGIESYTASDSARPQLVQTTKGPGSMGWPAVPTPDGRFMYAAAGDSKKLAVYTIGRDGELAPVGVPLTLPDIPVDIAFSPDSSRAYVTVGVAPSRVQAYDIAPNGVPTPVGSPKSSGNTADGLSTATVSPDGRTLYVTGYFSKQVIRYRINGDGTLQGPIDRVGTGMGAIFLTFSPDGRHAYVSNEVEGDVSGFNVAADGSLTPAPGSPFKSGALPHISTFSHDGRYLYVPNTGSNSISGYAVQADGGLRALPGSPYRGGPDGTAPEALMLSPSGRVVWDADSTIVSDGGVGRLSLHKFVVQPDGSLKRDDSASVQTSQIFADGRGSSLVPGISS